MLILRHVEYKLGTTKEVVFKMKCVKKWRERKPVTSNKQIKRK